jgi:diaminopimelate epimerase
MRFAKAHGTGNDFIVLPDPDGEIELTPTFVAKLCDRRRGIGGDGVLRVVRSAKHPDAAHMAADAEWFMDYYNGDGSIAEMCGNGVRAYARYLVVSGLISAAQAKRLPVATRAGIVTVDIRPELITVDMPVPVIGAASATTVAGVTYRGPSVGVGNPHIVVAVASPSALAALDLRDQPGYDTAAFPTGVNLEFVAAAPPVEGADLHVEMRVHERGVGETLSCGSGTCAVAAVALRDAGLERGRVAVDVPGGRLVIEIDAGSCRLTGPALVVATGEINVAGILDS